MAFNPKQFKQKKKRAVDPNAPPRPNLLSHEKKLKESQAFVENLYRQLTDTQNRLADLEHKYKNMQISMQQMLSVMRRAKR